MKNAIIGSRELKTRLGTYLELVRKGKTIVVTDRGKPVAVLKPIGEGETTEADRIAELMALGLVTRKSKAPLASFRPHRMAGKQLSDAVLQDREDRF